MSQKITITIDTGNAAFDDGAFGIEVARILRNMAEDIADETEPEGINGKRLYDYNGNRVGAVTVKGGR